MSVKSRVELKSKFLTGMTPSESDFGSVFDSFVHENDGVFDAIDTLTDAVNSKIDKNTPITAGIATKVEFNSDGVITAYGYLVPNDIPNLDWAKIATGKPNTLAGYGITDAATITQLNDTIAGIINNSPDALNTLKELADALGDDQNFSTTVTNLIADKLSKNAPIVAGTATKITYDANGLITDGTSLAASDIPALDWSKITSGKPTTLAGYGITDAATSADVDVQFTDNNTGNVSILMHGFAPKLPNDATKFLNGIGTWTVPAGGGGSTHTIQTAGTNLPAEGKLNFSSAFAVTDDPANGATKVDIAAPANINGRVTDYPIKVGETVSLTYTSATSVPLHVATPEGEYEITLIGNRLAGSSGTPILLTPNSSSISNVYMVGHIVYSNDTQTGFHRSNADTGIPLGFNNVVRGTMRLSTYTVSKTLQSEIIFFDSAGSPTIPLKGSVHTHWTDTTTVWASLGTISFPFAQTGTIIIRRIL